MPVIPEALPLRGIDTHTLDALSYVSWSPARDPIVRESQKLVREKDCSCEPGVNTEAVESSQKSRPGQGSLSATTSFSLTHVAKVSFAQKRC